MDLEEIKIRHEHAFKYFGDSALGKDMASLITEVERLQKIELALQSEAKYNDWGGEVARFALAVQTSGIAPALSYPEEIPNA
jgi:hypothetical protein